jgi:hypothetical protein
MGWSGTASAKEMGGTGKRGCSAMMLNENRNYISQNENAFYKSEKIFFKPSTGGFNKYSYSTPDYFRVDEKGNNDIPFYF